MHPPRLRLLVSALFLSVPVVHAQPSTPLPTGPGSVGTTDGTSALRLWLRADRGVTVVSNRVRGWSDLSGVGHTFSTVPGYSFPFPNTYNGRPAVFFGDNSPLVVGNGSTLGIVNDHQIFVVAEDGSNLVNGLFLREGEPDAANGVSLYVSTPFNAFSEASNKYIVKGSGAWTEDYITRELGSPLRIARRSGTTTGLSLAGGAFVEDTGTAGPIDFGLTPRLSVGALPNGGQGYIGRIAEIVVYNRVLTPAEQTLVTAALTARYGLANADPNAPAAAPASHGTDVAGAIQVGGTKVGQGESGGLALVDNGVVLADGQYVLLSHDEATGGTASGLPDGLVSRLARTWYVNATELPPVIAAPVEPSATAAQALSVTLTFDLAAFGAAAAPASTYRLLVATAPAGPFVDLGQTATVNGSDVSFTVDYLTLTSEGAYLTLGSASGALPVELTAFEARNDGAAVRLAWTAASQTNNAGWHVDARPTGDGAAAAWRALGFVGGAGTTAEARTYGFDATGLDAGRYAFRLRQVDLDGTSHLSPAVEAVVGMEAPYTFALRGPQPATAATHAVLAVREAQHVQVAAYDLLGRRAAVLFDGTVEAGESATIPVQAANLASGVYLLRASGERFSATLSVVVR